MRKNTAENSSRIIYLDAIDHGFNGVLSEIHRKNTTSSKDIRINIIITYGKKRRKKKTGSE